MVFFDFEFDFAFGIGSYQLAVRRFIFSRLRGYVPDSDFRDLETALFGGGFGNILQRMFAFRGFAINGVAREDCEVWFNNWVTLGYDFDITIWGVNDWNYDFSSVLDISTVVVVVPEITYDFDNVQDCLVQYFIDQGVDDLSMQRYKLTINT